MLLGQLVPTEPSTKLTISLADGTSFAAAVDELGCFTIAPIPPKPFRLQVCGERLVCTNWLTLEKNVASGSNETDNSDQSTLCWTSSSSDANFFVTHKSATPRTRAEVGTADRSSVRLRDHLCRASHRISSVWLRPAAE